MSFFRGATNVNVTGGEVNEIHGNHIIYDQSRHHSNVNSNNTTNHTIVNSGNNNSSVYHGVPQNARNPNHANRGDANRPPSGSQGDQASFPNSHPGFPLPPIHPPMMQPQYLPPGSRVQNVDSFNVNNTNVNNVNNDNSTEYGIPTPRKRRKDRQRSGMDWEADDEVEEAARPRRSGAARNPHSPYGHSQRPTYGPGAFPTTSSAQFSPGHMQGMSPDVQKPFETLMQHVQEQTAPAEVEEDSSDEEEQDPRMTDPASLNAGMSNMSLDENRPPYSRVKSDPQNPYHPAPASAHTASPDPVRPESVPYLPEHMQHPFFMPPGPATPTSGPYTAYAPPPIPPWNGQHPPAASASAEPQSPPHTGTPHATPHTQGGANAPYSGAPMASPPPRPSGPTFNTIHGDYTKVDQSVHSTNIGSGNTHNTLIKDSYNDNSVRSYAQPTPKPRGQGRRR